MRIIAPKNDYYDYAAPYAIDRQLVYDRREIVKVCKQKDIEKLIKLTLPSRWIGDYKSTYLSPERIRYIFVGFCNKLYPIGLYKEDLYTNLEHMYSCYLQHNPFQPVRLNSSYPIENYIAPVFIIKRADISNNNTDTYNVVTNPSNLKELQFNHIVPPLEAFQELAMFLAKKDPDMYNLSDKEKLVQHGFNSQSFKHRR
jgi:hypothetical protein